MANLAAFGPQFWHDGEIAYFQNRVDPNTCDGPREATPEDAVRFKEAWKQFMAEAIPAAPDAPAETSADADQQNTAPAGEGQ